MAQRYSLYFSNADGEVLDFSADGFTVFGRGGDWGTLPFEMQLDDSPDGVEAVAAGVVTQRGTIKIFLGIEPTDNDELWDLHRDMTRILRPRISRRVPNRGWLYFLQQQFKTSPVLLRIPVAPSPWSGWNFAPNDTMRQQIVTEVGFTVLGDAWEEDPPTADDSVLKAQSAATWSTFSPLVTPGGDTETAPIWTFTGPTSGTLQAITIEKSANERIQFTNLGMVSGDTLLIPTGYMQKVPTLNGVSVYHKRSQDTTFFHLSPGSNSITITKNATSQSEVRITYRMRQQGL